ncbi:MAG: MDR family MFS transporter [Chloroflexi bacterium]|nr:MDR family MFS transporter [Chloroflexota bacterium]
METASAPQRGLDFRWLILGVTTIGSFMSLLDSTMVNIGLPTILNEFGANIRDGQWVVTGYTLALSVVIPVSGFLAERVGMKRLYMLTMGLFIIGSVLCGLAWDLPSLIAFRILQGLGGGMLQPLGMAIVYSVVTPLERPRFMAMLGLPMLVGPLLGPTFGGYLVEYVDWRAMFTINLPIGAVGLALAWFILRNMPSRKGARLDLPGLALSTIAFPSLLLSFSFGAREGWASLSTLGLLAAGVAALATWIYVELHTEEPLLDLRLFANPVFRLAMGLTFVLNLSLFGTQFLLPLYLQTARGLGAMEAGMVLMPQGIASFISMNLAGRLYNRVGPRPLVFMGLSVMAFSTWEFSRIDPGASTMYITLLAMARGFAIGFCFMPNQTAAYNTVPQPKMARATALANGLQRVFGSFSTAFLGTVLSYRILAHSTELAGRPNAANNASLTAAASSLAFNDAFLLLSVVCMVGIGISFFLNDPVLKQKWAEEREKAAGGLVPAPAELPREAVGGRRG